MRIEFTKSDGSPRPIRLSEATRVFAFDSLNHKYGLDTKQTPAVSMDDIPNFEKLPPLDKYDAAIERIVKEAPIRICDGEKVSGAATLGNAIGHLVPATYEGKKIFISVSHLTLDFETVLKCGIRGIKENALRALKKFSGSEKERFIRSCLHCIDCMELFRKRYIDALAEKGYARNANNLKKVPFEPAESFYEAVQSIWFTFAFARLCGNWPGIGRLDMLLGDYLSRDLKNGAITLGEAREILAHFFIKGCEWICGGNYGSGDAQHYQNIVLCGVDENGNEIENEVSHLVLDIIEELGIGDFPTTVRLNSKSSERLLRRVAEVIRCGGGVIAIYGEDTVLAALEKDGYPIREARKFANDGCWEVQIPGKTKFEYIPFDSLQILQNQTLCAYSSTPNVKNFDELYSLYISHLRDQCERIYQRKRNEFTEDSSDENGWTMKPQTPCTVISLFEGGCIENGASYLECGTVYNVVSPHIGGVADTVNSLYAIKKLVFDEKRLSLAELIEILANDWKGHEDLRLHTFNSYVYYGNDNDEIDLIMSRLLSDFADICASLDKRSGHHYNSGVSTFGRQLEWSKKRLASPHGKKAGEVLAANCSPTPGTDKESATAIIRSYCKIDHTKLATGSALDIRLLPSVLEGERGLSNMVSLLRAFVSLGGFFMQPDVVDASVLRRAQEHPENYQTLSVRISGWNARFVTLNREWQEMIIKQNEHY